MSIGRPCLDCGVITTKTRCPACRSADMRRREQVRGNRQARGYDTAHDRARRSLAATLPDPCGYCGELVQPGSPWVAAHVVDGDASFGWVAAHVACNERAKGGHRDRRERAAALVPARPVTYAYNPDEAS